MVHLQGGGITDQQAEALLHEGGLRGRGEEHDEAEEFGPLGRHPVDDAAVDEREDDMREND